MPDLPPVSRLRAPSRRILVVLTAQLVLAGIAASLPVGAAPAPSRAESAPVRLASTEDRATLDSPALSAPSLGASERDLLASVPELSPSTSPGAQPSPARASAPAPAVKAPVSPASRPAPPAPYHVRVGSAALAQVRIDPAALGYRVVFAPERPGYLGLTDTRRKVITIYVRPAQSPELLAHVVAHELGHAYETTKLRRTDRAEFLRIRGIQTSKPWYPTCSGCTDFNTGAGDFAETFAVYWTGSSGWYSKLGAPPTEAQLRALGPLMSR